MGNTTLNGFKIAVAASLLALFAGCQSTSTADMEQARSDLDRALQMAQEAQETAQEALDTARAAQQAADRGEQCCQDMQRQLDRAMERLNEK